MYSLSVHNTVVMCRHVRRHDGKVTNFALPLPLPLPPRSCITTDVRPRGEVVCPVCRSRGHRRDIQSDDKMVGRGWWGVTMSLGVQSLQGAGCRKDNRLPTNV